MRSNVYMTSAEVNGSPLWNVALVTRSNIQVFVVDLLPRRGEVGHELPARVDVDELGEDVLVDLGAGVDRRVRRIERVRLAGQRGAQRAAVLDRLRHRRAAGEGHDEAERERGERAEDATGPGYGRSSVVPTRFA